MSSDAYLQLWQAIYEDACTMCPATVPDSRDVRTVTSRVEQEGWSFLTLTLPRFCTDFERCLAQGFIDSAAFLGFRKAGAIPAFLQGMLSLLFDSATGGLRGDSPDTPSVVDAVRQTLLAFKKVGSNCSVERNRAAIEGFASVEASLTRFQLDPVELQGFLELSHVMWGSVVGALRVDDAVFRHGKGSTAERILGNQKFRLRSWHSRLEERFPVANCYPVGAFGSHPDAVEAIRLGGIVEPEEDLLNSVRMIQEDDEPPVKVVLVPKTLKAPRVIAKEPVCMQYVQQGLRALLQECIESSRIAGGHVNFRDQHVNRELAIAASRDGAMSTIDLSDASDRVPWSLAMAVIHSNPDLRDAVDRCRSRRAKLPDGRVIGLRKFASMGSALCFVVEALYFYTVCVKGILDDQKLPYTWENAFHSSREVFVYGDDIIVPTRFAGAVLSRLRQYNCKPNPAKTFTRGLFRESCGMDAYAGECVTPVYVRAQVPEHRGEADRLVSWVATANLFYRKGMWRAASLMFSTCERHLGSLPFVSEDSPLLGRVSFSGWRTISRWSPDLHAPQVKGWKVKSVKCSDDLDGYPALQKVLARLEGETPDQSYWDYLHRVLPNKDHLSHSDVADVITLKRRWASV